MRSKLIDTVFHLSDVFSNLLKGTDTQLRDFYRKKMKGLILLIFGICIWDIVLIRKGAAMINQSLALVIEAILNLRLMKKFRKEGRIDMIRAKFQAKDERLNFSGKMLKSLEIVSSIILENNYLLLPSQGDMNYE